MIKEVKEKWIKALRSGEYEQGRNALCSSDSSGESKNYCCLGVLCDLAVKEGVIPEPYFDSLNLVYVFESHSQWLPDKVLHWLIGERDDMQSYANEHFIHLGHLNDVGTPFDLIADRIDQIENDMLMDLK